LPVTPRFVFLIPTYCCNRTSYVDFSFLSLAPPYLPLSPMPTLVFDYRRPPSILPRFSFFLAIAFFSRCIPRSQVLSCLHVPSSGFRTILYAYILSPPSRSRAMAPCPLRYRRDATRRWSLSWTSRGVTTAHPGHQLRFQGLTIVIGKRYRFLSLPPSPSNLTISTLATLPW